MNINKNSKLFSGLALIFTLVMITSAMPVYADDVHEETKTVVEEVKEEPEVEEIEEETEEPEIEEEPVVEEVVEEVVVEETVPAVNASNVPPSSDPLTPQKGVVYYNGHRETYYSQKVLPGGGLNIPGRHVAADGTIRDADNYICVASSDYPKGTIVETSLGTGKVYDSGCASGTIDIYTNW